MARTPVHRIALEELVAEDKVLRATVDRPDARPTVTGILQVHRDHVPAWLEEILVADETSTSSDMTFHDGTNNP